MDSVEEIYDILELTEVKKQRVQEAIISLLIEWKGFEEHVDSTHHSLKDCFTELESREKNLISEQGSLSKQNKEIEANWGFLKGRIEEVDCKEREIQSLYEEQRKELELKEENLKFCIKSLEERVKDDELREEKLNSRQRLIDDVFQKFNLKEEDWGRIGERYDEMKLKEKCIEIREIELDAIVSELDMKQQNVLDKGKELELKEKDLDSIQNLNERKSKELVSKEDQLVSREKELVSREKELDSREKQLDSVKNFIQGCYKDYRTKKKELELERKSVEERSEELKSKENDSSEMVRSIDLKQKEFDSIKILSEKRGRELEFREKKLDDQLKEFELKEKHFKERVTSFDLKEKEINSIRISCEERCRELELREKQLHNRLKEFELKEKNFCNVGNISVKTEPAGDDCSFADIRFFVTMDGKNLQLYLCEHERDLDSMADDVSMVLRQSMDPAKLVLDAMEGFYPPHLKKGDKEFGVDIIRRSCILLLEQLRRISPRIKLHVKAAALKLAEEWKVKMIAGVENSLEVIGFLQLLACYGLDSAFEPGELLSLLEVLGQHRQISELCQLLGFTDKISDFIQSLLEKEDCLQAIRYICAFELGEKFPPVPILKAHLSDSEEVAKKIRKEGENSKEAESRAINKELVALREVIKCITTHQLEHEYPPEKLFARIEHLERQNTNQMVVPRKSKGMHSTLVPALASNSESHRKFGKECHGRKRPRVEPPKEAAANDSSIIAYPLHPIHEPQLQGSLYAERGGPNVMEHMGPDSLGGLIPAVPPRNYLQNRPNVAVDGTTMLAGLANGHFGFSGSLNQQPSMLVGTRFLHHFRHNYGYQDCYGMGTKNATYDRMHNAQGI